MVAGYVSFTAEVNLTANTQAISSIREMLSAFRGDTLDFAVRRFVVIDFPFLTLM